MMAVIRCPICESSFNPDESPAMPFCSVRCKQADLQRWLTEGYGLPLDPEEEDQPEPNGDTAPS